MELSDIMGAANLSSYAEVALVIFLAVFVFIVARTWAPSRRQEFEAASRLPLDDDSRPGDQ